MDDPRRLCFRQDQKLEVHKYFIHSYHVLLELNIASTHFQINSALEIARLATASAYESGNMTHHFVATNKSPCSFLGSINAPWTRFLIYKAQKARHQVKIGCKANYPYRSWSADQLFIGAAVAGELARGPLCATCTDRHRRCQSNNHGEVGEMHCLCMCWKAWMIYSRWRKMSRFYTIAKDNA